MKPGVDYIKLNDEQLKQLKMEMFSLLIEVDRICEKHNIQYFLSDGTLLGAIRHKGFIPWDDDVDIQMFRSDYERFCEICKSELNNEKFFLQNQQNDKHYNWVFGKLRLKNTSYVRSGQEHLKQKDGICMDIFPIDNISPNKYKQKLSMFICKICRKILWAQVGKKAASTIYSKMLFKALSFIPRRVTIFIFDYFSKLYNKKETPFLVCHNLVGHIYKREWYDQAIIVNFEGHAFRAPERYDDILTSRYGEYMEIPPLDKQHGHSYASFIKFSNGLQLKL
ncbi:LicD family protein [Paenibacillus taiwanensis]|uniref:LicD family protein n=1 Tax=Paenibacillus taiwanensis TaxID=401638 RepID=UPI0003FD8A1B|nr:LicD family protein [Paenibacillus taiwanensis]